MSSLGWKVVRFDFEKRWSEGHRRGALHPWERSRVLAGNYTAIERELKPEFTEGQKLVLSRSRPRGALVLDRSTGEEIRYPKPPPEDLFWIIVTGITRHRAGHWRVRFDVFDRRDLGYMVRRKPPASPLTAEERAERPDDAQVALDSAYTTNPLQALDNLQAVPREYQNVVAVQAHSRFAEHKRETQAEQETAEDLRRLKAEINELVKRAAKMGIPPTQVLAPIAREITVQHSELRSAA